MSSSRTSQSIKINVPELNQIIETEFPNKRITRSMDRKAKMIKKEIIRKERKKIKHIPVIEILDDDEIINNNKSKKRKLKASESSISNNSKKNNKRNRNSISM